MHRQREGARTYRSNVPLCKSSKKSFASRRAFSFLLKDDVPRGSITIIYFNQNINLPSYLATTQVKILVYDPST